MKVLKNKRALKGILSLCICLALVISITINTFANIYLNDENKNQYNASLEIAVQIEAEGMVLLENDGCLPLASGETVSVFGTGSIDPFLGGGGAGAISAENPVGFYEALTNSGINYHEGLFNYYSEWYAQNKDDDQWKEGLDPGSAGMMILSEVIAEMPFDQMDADVWNSAVAQTDTAVFVISRSGSESSDVSEGALTLRESEKSILEQLDQNFENIIVLFNICNVMDMDFLDDYDSIKAAAIIWAPGEAGMTAVGQMLAGDINPSGKLADTIARNISDHPSSENFGDYTYMADGAKTGNTFVSYEEGIYVGYRYFETFDADVRYPFGYGLSYTTFDWTIGEARDLGDSLAVDVTVTNIGNAAGKDVVQVYYTAPYTEGGIEKSAITFGGYAKTEEIQPQSTDTVTIIIDKYYMSSYDMENGQYVLEGGNYEIKAARSVSDIAQTQTISIAQKVYANDPVTGTAIENQFKKASEAVNLNVLSRASGMLESTYPTSPNQEKGDFTQPEALSNYDRIPDPAAGDVEQDAPKFGQTLESGAMTLQDLYQDAKARSGADASLSFDDALYNSPLWDDFLSQLTLEEAIEMIINCGYKTTGVDRLGIPKTNDNDGPASVKGIMADNIFEGASDFGPGYPISTALACTFNDTLAEKFGERIGVDASIVGTNVWYAPATNAHRNPRGGRNFEYYSEDPVLAGKMTAAVTRGAQSQGLVVTLKHFAVNDQETNRMGVFTWVNEQSIREIYLKSFEIAVKEGGAKGIMSSFNRIGTDWAGGSETLLNNVLRDEWGFRGFVVTDQFLWGMSNTTSTYMHPALMLYGGGDAMLTGLIGIMPNMKLNITQAVNTALENDPIGFGNAIMNALKNLSYMKTFTNAFDDGIVAETPDTSILEFFIDYADQIVAQGELDNVIPTVANEFNEALKNAKYVLANSKSQTEIDGATERLIDIIQYLEFKRADTTKLIKLIALVERYEADKDSYIASTFTAFEEALANARAVAADEDLMNSSEVTDAFNALSSATAKLRLKPNKDKLALLLAKAKAIEVSSYTEESVAELTSAYRLAMLIHKDDEATKEDVKEAEEIITTALDGLKPLGVSTESSASSGTLSDADQASSSASSVNTTNTSNPKTEDTTIPMAMIALLFAGCCSAIAVKRKNSK